MNSVLFSGDFDSWRGVARKLIQAERAPNDLRWVSQQGERDMFADVLELPERISAPFAVPASFVAMASLVSFHSDGDRWALLYRVLWRILHENRQLLEIVTDDDVFRLMQMRKQVTRDAHKMKAFVRFKQLKDSKEFVAWYRPDHPILRHTAPFFARRFAGMHWTIFTPTESARWDGEKLSYGEGVPEGTLTIEDNWDDLWRQYYKSIFNPARVKVDAMKKEMPVRFWRQLPESRVIGELLQQHKTRTDTMRQKKTSARDFVPDDAKSLSELREAAHSCKGCPLYEPATQTVFGEGPKSAALLLVGEQPGNDEDLQGVPFVGPAGRLLNDALEEAGIDRKKIYLTNAVKHFKFVAEGKRRLHQKPKDGEIAACQPWLTEELRLVDPRVILCLGATAGHSVMGRHVKVHSERGKPMPTPQGATAILTFHPSALLRTPNEEMKREMWKHFIADLKKAHHLAQAPPQTPKR